MRRFFYLIAIAILGMMFACTSDDLDYQTDVDPNDKEVLHEKELLKYTNNLNNSFASSTRSTDKKLIYPDYFGGMYVNDEREITILIKSNEKSVFSDLTQRMGTNSYIVKHCDFSYNELQGLFDEITELWLNPSNDHLFDDVSLVSFGINDITNRVQFDLLDCSEANIQKFKRTIKDSPMLSFEKANGKLKLTSTTNPITPGTRIENAKGFGASVGYRAMKSGMEGFLTVGHFVKKGDKVKLNGKEIGVCEASEFSGNLDAAWIKVTNKEYSPSRETSFGDRLSTQTIATPTAGIYVNMAGHKSGLQRDKVLQNNINGNYTYEDENGNEQKTKV